MRERRERAYWIPEQDVLGLLDLGHDGITARTAKVVLALNLPEGFRVRDVRHDPMRRAFLFMVEHPSFADVPCGEYAPDGQLHCETLDVDVTDGEPEGTEGFGRKVRLFDAVVRENARLRGVFNDLRLDSPPVDAAYQAGYAAAMADAARKAAAEAEVREELSRLIGQENLSPRAAMERLGIFKPEWDAE